MSKRKTEIVSPDELARTEQIKRRAIVGIFSDDNLMEHLVLKGGNALSLLLSLGSRASVDIDLSMAGEFQAEELEDIREKLHSRLQEAFSPMRFHVFDVTLVSRPEPVSAELAEFWGGYKAAFKLIEQTLFAQCAGDLDALRRNCLQLGARGTFEIDISKFEYCAPKRAIDVDGLQVFIYTNEMLVAEKLRAICQQMPEYDPIVKRARRKGAARARDFYDIHALISHFSIDMSAPENLKLVKLVFEAKRVPLDFIGKIAEFREFHRPDFQSVKDTVKPGIDVRDFDFYFDFVLELSRQLSKTLGNK